MKARTALGVLAASPLIAFGLFACGKTAPAPSSPASTSTVPRAEETPDGGDLAPHAAVSDAGPPRAPSITHGPVDVEGLTSEFVQRIVRQNQGALRLCYEEGLRRRPGLRGQITVKFEIDSAGLARRVDDGASDMDDTIVIDCVRAVIGRLSFASPDGGVARVRYSWTFEPEPPAKGLAAGATALTTPPWPAGTNQELKLVWAAHPSHGQGEAATRNLELVARIGNVERRFTVGPQRGALESRNLGVCGPKQVAYKKVDGEIAKAVFGLAGHDIFVVKRPSPELLEIRSIQGPDGYCPKNDCDTVRLIGKIVIPASAKVTESFVDVDGAGKERPIVCKP